MRWKKIGWPSLRTWKREGSDLGPLNEPHAQSRAGARCRYEEVVTGGGCRRAFCWSIIDIINKRSFVEPFDTLELSLVDRVETDRAAHPLEIIGGVKIMQYTGETEYLNHGSVVS